jgi:spore germination protein GerM
LNDICTIDLSSEFIEDHSGGSAGELMTLASIVNTLTEFPSIQKVMILVKGQAGATLGNIILDKALDRMDELIGQ